MNKLKKLFLELFTATTIGATALTGCASTRNASEATSQTSSASTFNETYTIKFNSKNTGATTVVLTKEEYEEFLRQLKETVKNSGNYVTSNGAVTVERTYNIKLGNSTLELTESEFEDFANQLLGGESESKETETTTEEETTIEESTEEETTVEELTTENYENLVANYAIYLQNKGIVAVGTEDVAKFAAVTNIDILAEDNPDIIVGYKEENKTREEFLNDGAKVIGALVMNNFLVWNSTSSTADFARVSGVVFGEQRNQMLKIEDYQDRIADAVNAKDGALVNQIVAEFLADMNSGTLSKLDDGVGFAAQVCIATISDGIAKDYLNQENFDMFQILKTSEKYVANIFTVYEECGSHRSR